MKKILFISAATIISIAFTSCKKSVDSPTQASQTVYVRIQAVDTDNNATYSPVAMQKM